MDKLTYKPVSHDHEEFLREAKKDEEFRNEYEALAPAYLPLSGNSFLHANTRG